MATARLYDVQGGVSSQFKYLAGLPSDIYDMEAASKSRGMTRLSDFPNLLLLQTFSRDELFAHLTTNDDNKHCYMPFCVELDTQELVLISVDGKDDKLIQGSFISPTSRTLATRVLVVPATMANELVRNLIRPVLENRKRAGTGLRVFQGFMIGRCGSTLLTRAISAAASTAICFREPFCFDNLLPMLYKSGNMTDPDGELVCPEEDLLLQRNWSAKSDRFNEITQWCSTLTAFLLYYVTRAFPTKTNVFIKYRLPVLSIGINILMATPSSVGMFLTRDVVSSVKSQVRMTYFYNKPLYDEERNTEAESNRLKRLRMLDSAAGWFNWLPRWFAQIPVRKGYTWFFAARYAYASQIAATLTKRGLIAHTITYEQMTAGKVDFLRALLGKLNVPFDREVANVDETFYVNSQKDGAAKLWKDSESGGKAEVGFGTANFLTCKPTSRKPSWMGDDGYEREATEQTLACEYSMCK